LRFTVFPPPPEQHGFFPVLRYYSRSSDHLTHTAIGRDESFGSTLLRSMILSPASPPPKTMKLFFTTVVREFRPTPTAPPTQGMVLSNGSEFLCEMNFGFLSAEPRLNQSPGRWCVASCCGTSSSSIFCDFLQRNLLGHRPSPFFLCLYQRYSSLL